MKEESAILSLVVNLLLLSIGGALVVSYMVGYRITRKQLRPIGVLGRAMKEMSAARLSDRLETENIHTELAEVVHSYNEMLDKIEDAYERQKQFVSDASHELRTPLAVIRGYADILSRWGAEDENVRQEAVEAILAQSENMQTLLERLLYIARSESGKIRADLQKIELAPICAELLQDFKMMHPSRTFLLEGEVTALCDGAMMRQLLTVLLDNAAKFTKEGGEIKITLSSRQGKPILSVTDDGIGMEPQVAERIFERFYKGDSSHNEKGYGLGLSIAKLLAEGQGGSIIAQSQAGQGSTFTVILN
jgi:signal transduction histidine kinase